MSSQRQPTLIKQIEANADLDVLAAVAKANEMVSVVPVLDTAIYAAGDTLFATTEIANAVREAGDSVIVDSIIVVDKSDQAIPFDVYFFASTVTFGTLNDVPSISDADLLKGLGWVPVAAADYKDLGGARIATVRNVGLGPIKLTGTSLFIAAVSGTGTPTYLADSMTIKIGLRRE